jgi:hypothetical protein
MVRFDPLLFGSAAIKEGSATEASLLIVMRGLDPLLCGSAAQVEASATKILRPGVMRGLDPLLSGLTLHQRHRDIPGEACHGGSACAGQGLGAARTPTIACGMASACLELEKRT